MIRLIRCRKRILLGLAAMMLIISGCSSGSANASRSRAKEEIAAIQTAVGEAQPIVDYMKKYINWQVTTTEASMKEEHEALDAGKAYVPSVDPQTEYDQVKSIADELKTYGENMKKISVTSKHMKTPVLNRSRPPGRLLLNSLIGCPHL